MRFHATAPTRIDLAGGTLDLWPLYLLLPRPLTLNIAITRYAHCLLEPRRDRRIMLASCDAGIRQEYASLAALRATRRHRLPLLAHMVDWFAPQQGLTLSSWSEVPPGSGLGGSSALAVALIAALARWQRASLPPADWVPLARDIEVRVLGVPTGEQDHYPAVYGGVEAIHLEPCGTRREKLAVSRAELASRLVLAYTGEPRRSGINNWQVFKGFIDGNAHLRRNLTDLAGIAVDMRAALLREDWTAFARLLRREWATRRRNAPAISTPDIDRLISIARRRGAQAAKVCGAGGGGCVVFFAPPERRAAVAAALAASGATLLPFRIARHGARVEPRA